MNEEKSEEKPKLEEKPEVKVEEKPKAEEKKPEVKEKGCTDAKCPIHGSLGTHGSKIKGVIVSDRMDKSAVVERDFVKKLTKYERYEKRKTRITVHNPSCINAKLNDTVLVQECRPLSKTKSFVIIEKLGK